MKSAMIRLSLVENVNNFVNIVARYQIYSDDCSDLLEEISPFLMKEE